MEHYVTLFNSIFLPQGLALHASMERHIRDYVLWILCVDDEAFNVLNRLDLPNVCCLRLSDLETPELLLVKQSRTIAEYCWTLTPFAPRFVFEANQEVERVTYIDADLWFLKNPQKIFDEFDASSKHVLITEHAYSPECDRSFASGHYCVQFMTFSRNGSEHVRRWWEECCIEWCFARLEDGKFGDQKYLDDWPDRFGDLVHVLQDRRLTLAPWNASRFPYSSAAFFHFHSLRLTSLNKVDIGLYYIPAPLRNHVYLPYFVDLKAALNRLLAVGFCFTPQADSTRFVRRLFRKLTILAHRIFLFVSDSQLRF
jgi:hypothetical protein